MQPPRMIWEFGTAYDMLVSLIILHDPARFGVRGMWASGMRSRLPASSRTFMEEIQGTLVRTVPLGWVHSLPDPRDGATLLWALEQVPPAARIAAMTVFDRTPAELVSILNGAAARGAWDKRDEDALFAAFSAERSAPPPARRDMATILKWWANAEEFGARYLQALRAYYEGFFAEEESRIRPVLQQALAEAQLMAARLPLPRLLENLSQGVRFTRLPEADEYVLAPSFWGFPLLFHHQIAPGRWMFLFGARPPDASLVPGEAVPDALVMVLKALGDPTRLRILRYLSGQTLTPTMLAGRLRLRTPTVIYHLNTLRMAGLVAIELGADGERGYTARPQQVGAAFEALSGFLGTAEPDAD